MRRIVAFDRVSADGYFSAPNGQLDWTVPEPDLDKDAVSSMGDAGGDAGTVLFGRKTYDMFESFWPHVLNESPDAPDPHMPGRRAPEMKAMAQWLTDATKIVFTKSRPNATWANTRLVRDYDPAVVESLKAESGRDIMVFGSGTLVSWLAEHDLVDEYDFIVGPVLLGTGKSLVQNVSKRAKLELIECKAYEHGNVKLRYGVAR